jgi:hypothetical protein
MDVLLACAPLAGAVALGWFLRQSVCSETDGEVRRNLRMAMGCRRIGRAPATF